MRTLTISALIFLGGCTTIASFSEKLFGKDCEIQAAVAEETIVTTAEAVAVAVVNNNIAQDDGEDLIDKLVDARDAVKIAGSKCPLDEAAAISEIKTINENVANVQGAL